MIAAAPNKLQARFCQELSRQLSLHRVVLLFDLRHQLEPLICGDLPDPLLVYLPQRQEVDGRATLLELIRPGHGSANQPFSARTTAGRSR